MVALSVLLLRKWLAMTAADRREMVRIAMDAMVPLRVMELRTMSPEQLLEMAPDLSEYIASNGDDIEFEGKGIAKLATGIAVLILLRPEGVDLFGGHWCRDPECKR